MKVPVYAAVLLAAASASGCALVASRRLMSLQHCPSESQTVSLEWSESSSVSGAGAMLGAAARVNYARPSSSRAVVRRSCAFRCTILAIASV